MTTTEVNSRPAIARGLEGVNLCETSLADVDGQRGRLTIQGYDIRELAGKATFEEVAYLLWHGELPTQSQYDEMRQEAAQSRRLPQAALDVLRDTAPGASGMHA